MGITDWMTLDISEKRKLYKELCTGLTPHKQSLFNAKVANRTRHFSLGLEDMMKTQNASALMRTADAFGVHRVEKWLDTTFFNTYNDGNQREWANQLKSSGRKLYVTAVDSRARPIESLDASVSATICFGNEHEGASDLLQSLADELIYIPMQGFVESFNVSVSCGIVLHHLTHHMELSGVKRGLEEEDELNTLIQWSLRTVSNPHQYLG
jgi:tRNA (guanosine-2'-O-)-methyltransferase